MKKLTLMCIILIIILSFGCYKRVIVDKEIKSHWIKKEEPAPFDGILLNDYTYTEIINKLKKYKDFCKCPE